MIRIVLVDDHDMVRAGLRMILERQSDMCVVGEAAKGPEAIAVILRELPQIAIIDVDLPSMSGLDVLETIKRLAPGVAEIMITGWQNEAYLYRSLEGGAAGFLLKQHRSDVLIQAVRAVARGEKVIDWPSVPESNPADLRILPRHSVLTQRECDVLRLVAHGHSNPGIAAYLGISPKTVDSHRAHLMDKLDVHHRADLIRYALEKGYLMPSSEEVGVEEDYQRKEERYVPSPYPR